MMNRGKNIEKVIFEKFGIPFKELLVKMYWEQGKSQKDIAKDLCISTGCVSINFKKYDIQQRPFGHWAKGQKMSEEHKEKLRKVHKGKVISEETKKKMSEARKGFRLAGNYEKFSGRRNRADGYIQIYKPEHPFSNSEGYVMEHRLVMEEHLGRHLTQQEEIHHINHIRNDNRIENLHLFASKKDHMKFHMLERHGKREELKYEYQ